MAVDVIQSRKEKEDPLDKIVKLSSIGIGVAGLMGKGGGEAKSGADTDTSAMTRRLDELKAGNASAMENSKFAEDKYTMSAAPKKKGFGLGIKY